jgi:hypothetical protein
MASYEVEISPEMMDMQMNLAKVMTPLSVVGGAILSGLIGGLYMFICGKIAKSEITFKQSASIAYHMGIIGTLSYLLFMLFMLVGIDFSLTEPLTSIASLLPNSLEGSVVHGLLLPFEVFSVWGSVVSYLAFRIVGDMSKRASIISVMVAFGFGILVSGGSAVLTSLMSNVA